MAERLFRSPGFFDAEIDLTQREQPPVGTPAGIIGTALKGPAFVPVTVGSFADFKTKFGNIDPTKFGPYAVTEFLKNRNAVTYVRTLGAGAISSSADIENERTKGTRPGAGFRLSPTGVPGAGTTLGHTEAAQFIVAEHFISASETIGMPLFTDNDSFNQADGGSEDAFIVRAMIIPAAGTRVMAASFNGTYANGMSDTAQVGAPGSVAASCFKLRTSS